MIATAERIKTLRENFGLSQAELAGRLDITRSSVNAWEMGISVPSTQYIVELAQLFGVSTDFILCVPQTQTISIDGLTGDDIRPGPPARHAPPAQKPASRMNAGRGSPSSKNEKTVTFVTVFHWWGWRGSNPRPLACEKQHRL